MNKQRSCSPSPNVPNVLESVIKCNQDLSDIIKKYEGLSSEFLPIPKESFYRYSFFVDLNEKQPEFAFSGYFYIHGFIMRFLKIIFDYSFLFPIREIDDECSLYRNGISYERLKILSKDQTKMILYCNNPISESDEIPLYNKCAINQPMFRTGFDDIGIPFNTFEQVESMSQADIPSDFLDKKFSLVGINHYAPLTANDAYCVLYAEENNAFDKNAIKVLRWLPQKKSSTKMYSWGDYFFELGYISRFENEELHDFMVNNHSRILFGKKNEDKITLLGGISIFFDNDFYYPKCLSQIPIL